VDWLRRHISRSYAGGELLHGEFWHPLPPPMFHRPPKVRSLAEHVEPAWEGMKADIPQDDGGWSVAEVSRLLRVYRHAAGECVVTELNLSGDEERARRVRIRWQPR
jgi:hypothetical protein